MTKHLDDNFLVAHLAALEKGWLDSLAREREANAIIAGILMQSGGSLTVAMENVEAGQRKGYTKIDSSTDGERSIRLEIGASYTS